MQEVTELALVSTGYKSTGARVRKKLVVWCVERSFLIFVVNAIPIVVKVDQLQLHQLPLHQLPLLPQEDLETAVVVTSVILLF